MTKPIKDVITLARKIYWSNFPFGKKTIYHVTLFCLIQAWCESNYSRGTYMAGVWDQFKRGWGEQMYLGRLMRLHGRWRSIFPVKFACLLVVEKNLLTQDETWVSPYDQQLVLFRRGRQAWERLPERVPTTLEQSDSSPHPGSSKTCDSLDPTDLLDKHHQPGIDTSMQIGTRRANNPEPTQT